MSFKSLRFFPDWSENCGRQVTGLIELVNFVYKHNNNDNQTWCEIGSARGESSLIIASFDYIETLYCIDPSVREDFYPRINHIKHKIHLINEKSETVYSKFVPNFFDAIYIDGNHSYSAVKSDLNFAIKCVKPNGFICGHDYSIHHPGTVKAVDEFILENNLVLNKNFIDSSFAIKNIK